MLEVEYNTVRGTSYFMGILIVAFGAFIGAIFRYLLMLIIRFPYFPLSILVVNAIGSFLIGVFSIVLRENIIYSYNLYIFITAGILGGFTSFSTFSLETILLFENGRVILGLLNILLSVTICLFSTLFGRFLANLIFS